LYSPLNSDWLRALGVDEILGGEFEAQLVATARRPPSKNGSGSALTLSRQMPRLAFVVPDRSGLPPLARYATLQLPDGSTRVAGYTEASRGCRHL
jgi:hypothetical protein